MVVTVPFSTLAFRRVQRPAGLFAGPLNLLGSAHSVGYLGSPTSKVEGLPSPSWETSGTQYESG